MAPHTHIFRALFALFAPFGLTFTRLATPQNPEVFAHAPVSSGLVPRTSFYSPRYNVARSLHSMLPLN